MLPSGRQAYVTDENDGTIEILNIAEVKASAAIVSSTNIEIDGPACRGAGNSGNK